MDRLIFFLIPIVLGLWIGWLLSRRRTLKDTTARMQVIPVETFKQNMRKGQLIDIRKRARFEEDKIKGARHFSVRFLRHKSQIQVRKDKPLYLYCQNGRKAKRAARKLLTRGYVFVYVLEGGFEAYKASRK